MKRINKHNRKKNTCMFINILDLYNAQHDNVFYAHMLSAHVVLDRLELYHCSECTQDFPTKRQYMLHRVKHIQNNVKIARTLKENGDVVKPYQCPDCDATFVAESTLDAHSVIHKPFPHICECGIGYYKKQDLASHRKIVHATRTKLPWKPKIDYTATQENKQKRANTRINGPKLKVDHLFASTTTVKSSVKKKRAKMEDKH